MICLLFIARLFTPKIHTLPKVSKSFYGMPGYFIDCLGTVQKKLKFCTLPKRNRRSIKCLEIL